MDTFVTHTMALLDSNGNVRAQNLLCQLDPVNVPLNMEVQSLVPTDWFDLYSIGWSTPLPARSDYFQDSVTGTRYSMFSTLYVGPDTVQLRVTKYTSKIH